MPVNFPVNKDNYVPVNVAGTWYIAAPVESVTDNPITYGEIHYIRENPVNMDIPSKQEMRRESLIFKETASIRDTLTVSGTLCYLAEFPNDFLIQSSYQPGNMEDVPEFWQLTGFYIDPTGDDPGDGGPLGPLTVSHYSFIANRAKGYINNFTFPGTVGVGGQPPITALDVEQAWEKKIAELIAIKY